MTTQTSSQRLVAAVHNAYCGSGPCRCEGQANITEDHLLHALVRRKLVLPRDCPPVGDIKIWALYQWGMEFPHGLRLALREKAETIQHLTRWTATDLLALSGVTRRGVDHIESTLASFGLLLKDGDPALLDQVAPELEEEIVERSGVVDPPSVTGNPAEIRDACASAVMKLASDVSANAASLMSMASRIATGKKFSGLAKTYAAKGFACGQELLRLAQPVLDLEDAARSQKGQAGRSVVKRETVAEPDNVIRPAFTA